MFRFHCWKKIGEPILHFSAVHRHELIVPDRAVQIQQALFNLLMGMWSEGKYVSLYIVTMLMCCLNLLCVSV